MKHLLVHNIRPGMKIGKDVYGNNNLLLIPRDTIVTNPIITNLLSHDVISVYIDDTEPADNGLMNIEPIQEDVNIKDTKEFKMFEQKHRKVVSSIHEEFQNIIEAKSPVDTEQLFMEVSNLFPSDMSNFSLFDMLHHMREYDDSTYIHCINVALISNVFGRWLRLPPDDLKVLTLCGLLHDIGKLKVPNDIIKKPGKLSDQEYEIIKQHPYFGYQILIKQKNLDPRIAQAALLHHERCDGYGYPMGFDRSKIIDFALIVAIADVYDAMTSARVYRDPLCPFTVIKYLELESMQRFDPHYFMTFNEQILATYINSEVKLSNGKIAKVVYINRNDLSHPIVKIGNECIDLSVKRDIEIVAMV